MVLKELTETLITSKINDNKIHIKIESLVKSAKKTFEDYSEHTPRAIVWLRYAISAIFCGPFNRMMTRV